MDQEKEKKILFHFGKNLGRKFRDLAKKNLNCFPVWAFGGSDIHIFRLSGGRVQPVPTGRVRRLLIVPTVFYSESKILHGHEEILQYKCYKL
jgi:hypothetical protein